MSVAVDSATTRACTPPRRRQRVADEATPSSADRWPFLWSVWLRIVWVATAYAACLGGCRRAVVAHPLTHVSHAAPLPTQVLATAWHSACGVALYHVLRRWDRAVQCWMAERASPPLLDMHHREMTDFLSEGQRRLLRRLSDGVLHVLAITFLLLRPRALMSFSPVWLGLFAVRTVNIVVTVMPAACQRYRGLGEEEGPTMLSMRHDLMFSGHAMALTLIAWGAVSQDAWPWLVRYGVAWVCGAVSLCLVLCGEHYTADVWLAWCMATLAAALATSQGWVTL